MEYAVIPRPIAVLAALCLLAPTALAQKNAPTPAAAFTIKGAVEHPRTVTTADLQHEAETNEAVFLHSGHGPITGTFTGVLLWTLLQEAGVKTDPAGKNDIARHIAIITGADGYSIVLSLGELDPEFGGAQAIIAYARDGKPIDDTEGLTRLVIPGDKGAGRAVNNIVNIEVK
jgi:DMSO/TMAO reductase YedYZ molybdopterin-dependent catalytic subunit